MIVLDLDVDDVDRAVRLATPIQEIYVSRRRNAGSSKHVLYVLLASSETRTFANGIVAPLLTGNDHVRHYILRFVPFLRGCFYLTVTVEHLKDAVG